MAPERLCKLMDGLSCNCADGVTGPACPDGLPFSSRRSSCLGDEDGYLALGGIDQASAGYWVLRIKRAGSHPAADQVPMVSVQVPAHQSKTTASAPAPLCAKAQPRGLRRIHELYFISLEHAAFY